MADKQKSPHRGNTPKPSDRGAPRAPRTRAAPPAGPSPVAVARPARPRPGQTGHGRFGLLAHRRLHRLGAVGLVVVIIAASSSSRHEVQHAGPVVHPVTPAAQVVHDVTTIPLDLEQGGVTTLGVQADSLTASRMSIDGKSPAMLYYGAEYCPTVPRNAGPWRLLARFAPGQSADHGVVHTTWTPRPHLQLPRRTLDSPYITFKAIEQYTTSRVGQPASTRTPEPDQGGGQIWPSTARPSTPERQQQRGSRSVRDINNGCCSRAAMTPAPRRPHWTDISGSCRPDQPGHPGILTTGNYMSAGICQATHGSRQRLHVSGVQAAAKALGISAS